jgi:hypothetical protein
MDTHNKHLRILQAAIRDFKMVKRTQKLGGKALLEFEHSNYSHLQQKYGIPQRIRTGKELMDKSKKDPSVLRQYRCLPISRYYSMLLENTPGYEKNTSSSADRNQTTRGGGQETRSDQNTKSDQNFKPKSDPKAVLMRENTPSYPPEHKAMQHRVVRNKGFGSSGSNEGQQSSNVDHHDGDQWMERRAKHLARPRNNTIAGEEYESESGNEWDDYNHSFFDERMTPVEKTQLAKWMYQIKRLKTQDYSTDYIKQRQLALDNAQREYERSGGIASFLSGVPPPWNEGTGLASTRYDEKIVDECAELIRELREKNANRCALDDAEKKRKSQSGPGGQGRR